PPAVGRGAVAMRLLFAGGDTGVYRLRDAQLEPLASAGASAPGGGRFAAFGATVTVSGDGGRIAFSALLDNGVRALFATDGATLTMVARTGEVSPSGGAFLQFRLLGVTNDGRVGFRAAVASGPDGLFFWDGAAIATLAVAGDASPIGGQFVAFGAGSMNDVGDWVFRATVSGPRSGVFRADTSTARATRARAVAELALLGETTDLGGDFRFTEPSVRDNAESAIFLGLREGIFVASGPGPGQTSLVAMLGESTPLGGRYQQFDPPAAGAGGRIVFAAAVLGPGFRRALFLAGPAGAVPLLETGDGAPG